MPNKSTKTYDNFNLLWDGPIMSPVHPRKVTLIFENSFIGRWNKTKESELTKRPFHFL